MDTWVYTLDFGTLLVCYQKMFGTDRCIFAKWPTYWHRGPSQNNRIWTFFLSVFQVLMYAGGRQPKLLGESSGVYHKVRMIMLEARGQGDLCTVS